MRPQREASGITQIALYWRITDKLLIFQELGRIRAHLKA